jgi:hypothetical protein
MFWQEAVIFKGSVVIFKVERRGDVAEALFPKKIRRHAAQVTSSVCGGGNHPRRPPTILNPP